MELFLNYDNYLTKLLNQGKRFSYKFNIGVFTDVTSCAFVGSPTLWMYLLLPMT